MKHVSLPDICSDIHASDAASDRNHDVCYAVADPSFREVQNSKYECCEAECRGQEHQRGKSTNIASDYQGLPVAMLLVLDSSTGGTFWIGDGCWSIGKRNERMAAIAEHGTRGVLQSAIRAAHACAPRLPISALLLLQSWPSSEHFTSTAFHRGVQGLSGTGLSPAKPGRRTFPFSPREAGHHQKAPRERPAYPSRRLTFGVNFS